MRRLWTFARMNLATATISSLVGGRALVAAWLICGVLDINAAFINSYVQAGHGPLWVLQAVAGALLGKASFDDGYWAGALGLAMHFFVAFNAATIFYLLSRRWPVVLRHAIPAGLVYGATVYLFMNCVTIPFCSWFRSLYLHTPVTWAHAKFGWPQFFIHLTCVGLAISLTVRQFSPASVR